MYSEDGYHLHLLVRPLSAKEWALKFLVLAHHLGDGCSRQTHIRFPPQGPLSLPHCPPQNWNRYYQREAIGTLSSVQFSTEAYGFDVSLETSDAVYFLLALSAFHPPPLLVPVPQREKPPPVPDKRRTGTPL